MRVGVTELAQVRAEFGHPLGVDAAHGARKELRGLDDLARDDPGGLTGLLGVGLGRSGGGGRAFLFLASVEGGAGEDGHLPVAGRLVEVALLALGNLAEQASEDRAVDGLVAAGRERRGCAA